MTKTDYAALRGRIEDKSDDERTDLSHSQDLRALLHRADLAEEMAGALETLANLTIGEHDVLVWRETANAQKVALVVLAKYREERG